MGCQSLTVTPQGNGQAPRAALLLPTSGTWAPSAYPNYCTFLEKHHPKQRRVRWSQTPHRQHGGLTFLLLLFKISRSSCSEEAPTRLSLGEAVVALTEGPCAGKPPPLTLFPKTAWSSQASAPTKVSTRLPGATLRAEGGGFGPTHPAWARPPEGENHPLGWEDITGNPFMGQKRHHYLYAGANRPPQAALLGPTWAVDMPPATPGAFPRVPATGIAAQTRSPPAAGQRADASRPCGAAGCVAGGRLYLEH